MKTKIQNILKSSKLRGQAMTTITAGILLAVYLDVFESEKINNILIIVSVLTGGITVKDAQSVIKKGRTKKNDL